MSATTLGPLSITVKDIVVKHTSIAPTKVYPLHGLFSVQIVNIYIHRKMKNSVVTYIKLKSKHANISCCIMFTCIHHKININIRDMDHMILSRVLN